MFLRVRLNSFSVCAFNRLEYFRIFFFFANTRKSNKNSLPYVNCIACIFAKTNANAESELFLIRQQRLREPINSHFRLETTICAHVNYVNSFAKVFFSLRNGKTSVASNSDFDLI